MACFTRPEMKVERVSYPFITPSAARAIFECIHWKPAIRWSVSRIEVLNPINWMSVRTNEIKGKAFRKEEPIIIEDRRQQRSSLLLKDVRYRIFGEFQLTERAGEDDSYIKHQQIFLRRAQRGQVFKHPCFGQQDYRADWKYLENQELNPLQPISSSHDFGLVFYDFDYSDKKNKKPMFFRAKMENGVILVPPMNSPEVLK
jgi:CRISPR-associated protein Cas5d